MARARRTKLVIVEDDGLDQVVTIDQDTPLRDYPPELLRLRTGFNGWAQLIEETWGPIVKASPGHARVKGYSREAYAHRLVWPMRFLQRMLARDDLTGLTRSELQGWITAAVRLGYDWADARWRFNRGHLTRTGVARRTHSREAGKKSGEKRAEDTDERRQRIAKLAREIRQSTPYDRKHHSTRWLAGRISRKLNMNFYTVKRALGVLKRP